MTTRLKLHLLGSFDATLDDAPLEGLRSDRVRALLAFLAVEGKQHHRREYLASLLWGEFSEKSARASLRVSLANLRQALSQLEDPAASAPFLQISRQNVRLDVNHPYCWVDSITFDRLLADSNDHSHTKILDCAECMQRLTHAISLYRNGFLSGLTLPDSPTFDEWRMFQQEARHQQALATLSLLTTYHLNQKSYDQARRYATRQIELEPWREEAHRQVMQILAANNQRGSALTQYETCRRILVEELGAEPSVETTMLYEQIKTGEFKPHTLNIAAPSTVVVPKHNLPSAATPFVGRVMELERLTELVKNPDCRLLSLTGPGGVGKTRLALQAAGQQVGNFKDGVYLLSMVGVNSTQTLIDTLAQVLDFSFYSGSSPQAQLQYYLREKQMLLILDGFEHLLMSNNPNKKEAAELAVELLQGAPELKILVTSRKQLNVFGEWILTMDELDYPVEASAAKALNQFGAIEFFVQCVQRVQPNYKPVPTDLSHISKICQLLNGMPLAIEMVAAWLQVVSCQDMLRELQQNVDSLKLSMPDMSQRRRNLRAVFDFSWQRLSAKEKQVYRELSVFGHDFDQLAAENVAGAAPEILASLVDKSLLTVTSSGKNDIQPRYSLHDLLQRYAAHKLSADPVEQVATRQRHSLYYLSFLQQAELRLKSWQQLEALQAIGLEIANIRQSWYWAIAHRKIAEINCAVESLFLFFYMRSWYQEGEAAFSQLVQLLSQLAEFDDYRVQRHKATVCKGWFIFQLNRKPETKTLLEKSLLALKKLHAPAETAFCSAYLGAICQHLGDYHQANQLGRECLQIYRELDDNYGAAMALNILGRVAYLQSSPTKAELLYQESLDLHREIGDQWGIAFSLEYLGQLAFSQQNYQAAQPLFEESLATRQIIGDLRGTAQCYIFLGNIAIALDKPNQAEQLYQDALTIFKRIGYDIGVSQSLANLEQVIILN